MDITPCYHCFWPMSHWTEDMDPWIEHVRINPSCFHLRLVKGTQWVRKFFEDLRNHKSAGACGQQALPAAVAAPAQEEHTEG